MPSPGIIDIVRCNTLGPSWGRAPWQFPYKVPGLSATTLVEIIQEKTGKFHQVRGCITNNKVEGDTSKCATGWYVAATSLRDLRVSAGDFQDVIVPTPPVLYPLCSPCCGHSITQRPATATTTTVGTSTCA